MDQTILQQLRQLEQLKEIKIIYACESGSRSYGTHSGESDYDVKFIYCKNLKRYLSLTREPDIIDQNANPLIEIHGWDIFKTLELFKRSNPSLYEWLFSPVIYREDKDFLFALREIAATSYSLRKISFHYLSLTNMNIKTLTNKQLGGIPLVKTLLQAARGTLSILYILENKKLPPIKFLDLVGEVSLEANDKELLYGLLEKKRAKTNLNNLKYDHLLSFLKREGSKWEEHIRKLPDKKMDVQILNELLWKQLGV